MRKSRYTQEQIIGFIKQADASVNVAQLCRKEGAHGAVHLHRGLVQPAPAARSLGQMSPAHFESKHIDNNRRGEHGLPTVGVCVAGATPPFDFRWSKQLPLRYPRAGRSRSFTLTQFHELAR